MLNEEALPIPQEAEVPEEELETATVDARRRHDELVAAINKLIEDAETRNKPRVREYMEIKRLYRGQPSKDDTRGGRNEPGKTKANVGNLELFRCIESVTSAEEAVLFNDDPNIQLYDPDMSDQASGQLYHTMQLLEQGHERMGARTTHVENLRSGNTYGRLAVEVTWEKKTRWKLTKQPGEVDPLTGAQGPETEVYAEVVDYQRPRMRTIPPWRFFMDPAASRVKDARWIAIKEKYTKEDIADLIEYGKSNGMITRELESGAKTSESSSAPGETSDTVSESVQRGAGVEPEVKDTYAGINFWGLYPGGKEENGNPDRRFYHIVVIDGRKAIVEGVNPFAHGRLPVLDWIQIPEEETAEGLGTGQLLRRSQILINETEGLMQDMTMFGLYGVWQRQGALLSNRTKSVRIFPGRIFDGDVDGVVTRIPMDAAPFKLAQLLQSIRIEAMRAASGATSNVQALQGGGTATEIRTIAAESSRRLAGLAESYANQILRPFVEMELALYEQYLPDEEKIVSMVPVDGKMQAVPVAKAQLRLASARVRIKIASDLDFRKNMTRNLNQAASQYGQLIGAVGSISPEAGAEAAMGLLPVIFDVARKTLAINGIPPSTVPQELVDQIVGKMREAQAMAEQRKALEAQLAAAQPQGGPDVSGNQGVPAVPTA